MAANYGTDQDDLTATFTPPASPVTASDTTVLVSQTVYNDAGEPEIAIDTAGKQAKTVFDHAGRVKESIQNFVSGGTDSDENITTQTTYTLDGNVKTITAVNPTTGNQITEYTYGTTLTDSNVAHSDLLTVEKYPDASAGDATDRVKYLYNRQGEAKQLTDQNGTVHAYDRDKLGRLAHDRVTTLGAISDPVDAAIQRISTTYLPTASLRRCPATTTRTWASAT